MGVELALHEVLMGATIGLNRHLAALKRGLPDRHGFDGEGWNIHIEGACGELAAAKALNVHWDGSINTFRNGGDVSNYQVRTRSKHEYDLIVRKNDPDDAVFILVTGRAPYFRVHGWILGCDAKKPEFEQAYGGREPAWFVPKEHLHSLDELRDGSPR